jgi:hypothetical protein
MMDHADLPRQGDFDGLGDLPKCAPTDFIIWFLHLRVGKVNSMTNLFELDNVARRLRTHVNDRSGPTGNSDMDGMQACPL